MIGYFTIAHTGTQFFRREFFGNPGLSWKDLNSAQLLPDDIVFAHCETRSLNNIKNFNAPIVTTIRHPLYVAVSWYARKKLERGYDRFLEAWHIWSEFVQPRARDILSVDLRIGPSKNWNDKVNSETYNSLAHYWLANGDLDKLYTLIDRNVIKEALTLCGGYYNDNI